MRRQLVRAPTLVMPPAQVLRIRGQVETAIARSYCGPSLNQSSQTSQANPDGFLGPNRSAALARH